MEKRNFGREAREDKIKEMTLNQVLVELRDISFEVEKYSDLCLEHSKLERVIYLLSKRISQIGSWVYSSGIQE